MVKKKVRADREEVPLDWDSYTKKFRKNSSSVPGLPCLQEKEEEGRGRFKSHTTGPARIADREKKAPLKT